MRLSKFIVGLLSTTLIAHAALAENMVVVNAEGLRLSVIADFPSGDGKFPAIVLAPGQGYHMNLPAMDATARSLAEQGIAVFRFNWAYFMAEPKGQPSDDLSKELQDLQAVLAAARKHPKVIAQNLSVGGKSLGSVVAWRAFGADTQLRSALLLTPICSRVPKGATLPRSEAKENYPGFEIERRPTLSISGHRDPLCAPSILYGLAGSSAGTARVAIVGGDHGYENRALPPAAAEAARKRNLVAVSVLASSFVAETSSDPP
jgi:predicted alpha/beta-hydrolase family hydrolase